MDSRAQVTAKLDESLALLTQLESQHAAIVEASRESNADDEHDPEGATIGFERAQLVATIAATAAQVGDLRAALDRISAGTYGVCVVCGAPIPPERLEARPAATTCIRHAP